METGEIIIIPTVTIDVGTLEVAAEVVVAVVTSVVTPTTSNNRLVTAVEPLVTRLISALAPS